MGLKKALFYLVFLIFFSNVKFNWSFAFIIYTIITYFLGNTVAGWASMTSIICFIGGIQLIGIGVLGEYIGKIYSETKERPRYIISENLNEQDKK